MDEKTKTELLDATKPLIEADDWAKIESLWEPHLLVGDIDALGELACLYEYNGFNEGPEKDREIQEMLQKAADNGHADAAYCLAVFQSQSGQRDELIRKAAELGSRAAQRDLGAYYATGDWTGPKDPALAVYWYARAAERGEEDAQYNLGFMYILGEGTVQNTAKGVSWLRTSAEQGHTGAMRLLADLYRNAWHGVPRNSEEADHWDRQVQESERSHNVKEPSSPRE